jgi:hypothetical protein
LRTIPVNERDLFISAVNAHVLAYDNLSGMRDWISDALCRVSTGGSFAIRQNYTDQDEVLFDASNPIILNGIEDIIGRPDLADRAVFLRLEPISQELRRPESELWATFDEVYPRIFGALLGGLVTGLQRLPQISMPQLPRMADFAMWSVACETAFWPVGSFWAAYRQNHDEAVEGVVDQDPVATAVRSLMTDRPHWKGTATDLLPVLAGQAGDWSMRSKNWPNSPRQLSGALRRAAPFLREMGIRIDFRREGQSRSRMIYIGLEEFPSNKYSMGTSASSASSAVLANDCSGGETFGYGVGTVPDKVDGDEPLSSIIVRSNAMEPFDLTDADAADEDVGANSETWWSQRI